MKKLLITSLFVSSALFAGTIHTNMDDRIKGQSYSGTQSDYEASKDGLGLIPLQHHSGTTIINSELKVQKKLVELIQKTPDKTKLTNIKQSLTNGDIGTIEDQEFVNKLDNVISSSPTEDNTISNVLTTGSYNYALYGAFLEDMNVGDYIKFTSCSSSSCGIEIGKVYQIKYIQKGRGDGNYLELWNDNKTSYLTGLPLNSSFNMTNSNETEYNEQNQSNGEFLSSPDNLVNGFTPTILNYHSYLESRGMNFSGLFDGTTVNEWDTPRVAYWWFGSDYVEIQFDKAFRIWRSGTASWAYQNDSMIIQQKQSDGSYVDMSHVNQPRQSIIEGQWALMTSELPAGIYKFSINPSNAIGHLDSEWFVEGLSN